MIEKIIALIMSGFIAMMVFWLVSEIRTIEGLIVVIGTFFCGLYTMCLWDFVKR